MRFIAESGKAGIALGFYDCNKILFLSDSVCPTPFNKFQGMKRNRTFPNWKMPRRQPFRARRGIALLRALRLSLAEETPERFIQTQLEFRQLARSPRTALKARAKNQA